MIMVVKMAIMIMTALIAALCLKTDLDVFFRYGAPSYGAPAAEYGAPSSSYDAPSSGYGRQG